jgi:hypothetical protein
VVGSGRRESRNKAQVSQTSWASCTREAGQASIRTTRTPGGAMFRSTPREQTKQVRSHLSAIDGLDKVDGSGIDIVAAQTPFATNVRVRRVHHHIGNRRCASGGGEEWHRERASISVGPGVVLLQSETLQQRRGRLVQQGAVSLRKDCGTVALSATRACRHSGAIRAEETDRQTKRKYNLVQQAEKQAGKQTKTDRRARLVQPRVRERQTCPGNVAAARIDPTNRVSLTIEPPNTPSAGMSSIRGSLAMPLMKKRTVAVGELEAPTISPVRRAPQRWQPARW